MRIHVPSQASDTRIIGTLRSPGDKCHHG